MPVVVDVVVEAQRSAEPGALEFACVEVEIGLGEPVGGLLGIDEGVLEAGTLGHAQRSGPYHVDRIQCRLIDAGGHRGLRGSDHSLARHGVGQAE